MEQFEFELSPEARAQLTEVVQVLAKAFTETCQAIEELVMQLMEEIRKIAEQLGRFFLKMQLLEWRVPYPIADWFSRKMYWLWAWQIGMRWFRNKLLATG